MFLNIKVILLLLIIKYDFIKLLVSIKTAVSSHHVGYLLSHLVNKWFIQWKLHVFCCTSVTNQRGYHLNENNYVLKVLILYDIKVSVSFFLFFSFLPVLTSSEWHQVRKPHCIILNVSCSLCLCFWLSHLYIDNKFSTVIFYIKCEEEISKIQDRVIKNVQFDQKQEKTFLDLEN